MSDYQTDDAGAFDESYDLAGGCCDPEPIIDYVEQPATYVEDPAYYVEEPATYVEDPAFSVIPTGQPGGPVPTEDPTYSVIPTGQPGGPEQVEAPVETVTIGGPDLYPAFTITEPDGSVVDQSELLPNTVTIGGPDLYPAFTITDSQGNVVDPSTLLPDTTTIGGYDRWAGVTITDSQGNVIDPSTLPTVNPQMELASMMDKATPAQRAQLQQIIDTMDRTTRTWTRPYQDLDRDGYNDPIE